MGVTIFRHLDAHRFPSAGIGRSEDDFYLLEAEFTDNNFTNDDGTQLLTSGIFGHGSREQVREKMEDSIEGGLVTYRSKKRGDDYFRAGVENALNDALDAGQDVADRVDVEVGYVAPRKATEADNASDPAYQAIVEFAEGERWEIVECSTGGIRASAPVTSESIDGMLRVEEMQANGISKYDSHELNLFRRFNVGLSSQ